MTSVMTADESYYMQKSMRTHAEFRFDCIRRYHAKLLGWEDNALDSMWARQYRLKIRGMW